MRIACVQFSPALLDFETNLRRMTKFVEQTDADLVVMPELATSGYFFPSREAAASVAESEKNMPSADRMARAAEKAGSMAVVYGFVELGEGGKLYNSAAVVTPGGLAHVYRKIHLFNTEFEVFEPGDRPFEVVKVKDVTLGVMICFDWIFPESMRSLALLGADVICHAANLVLPYCQEAIKTRCLENRVFAATCNRVGTETRGAESLTFTGLSQITSPAGEALIRASGESEEIVEANVDPALARDKKVTPKNDVVTDRRPHLYRLD